MGVDLGRHIATVASVSEGTQFFVMVFFFFFLLMFIATSTHFDLLTHLADPGLRLLRGQMKHHFIDLSFQICLELLCTRL